MNKLIKQIKKANMTRGVGRCDFLRYAKSIDHLIAFLFSTEGLIFAKQTNYPDMEILRNEEIKPILDQYPIYVDTEVELQNIPLILLAGKTKAKLYFDKSDIPYVVALMHGAEAEIRSNNAIVLLYNISGKASSHIQNYGKIINL